MLRLSAGRAALCAVFQDYGEIVEIVILRDRRSNMHQVHRRPRLPDPDTPLQQCEFPSLSLDVLVGPAVCAGLLFREVQQHDCGSVGHQRVAQPAVAAASAQPTSGACHWLSRSGGCTVVPSGFGSRWTATLAACMTRHHSLSHIGVVVLWPALYLSACGWGAARGSHPSSHHARQRRTALSDARLVRHAPVHRCDLRKTA